MAAYSVSSLEFNPAKLYPYPSHQSDYYLEQNLTDSYPCPNQQPDYYLEQNLTDSYPSPNQQPDYYIPAKPYPYPSPNQQSDYYLPAIPPYPYTEEQHEPNELHVYQIHPHMANHVILGDVIQGISQAKKKEADYQMGLRNYNLTPSNIAKIFDSAVCLALYNQKNTFSMVLSTNGVYLIITIKDKDKDMVDKIRNFRKSLKDSVVFDTFEHLITYLYVNWYDTPLYKSFKFDENTLCRGCVHAYAYTKCITQIQQYKKKTFDTELEMTFVECNIHENIKDIRFCKEKDYVETTRNVVMKRLSKL